MIENPCFNMSGWPTWLITTMVIIGNGRQVVLLVREALSVIVPAERKRRRTRRLRKG